MRTWTTALLLAMCGWMTTVIEAETPVPLTVRLYNGAGRDVRLVEVREVATPILRDAGVDVIFRMCGQSAALAGFVDPCDDPLKPSEVVVRVIDAPKSSSTLDPDAYGMTYVIDETNRGWLATVFVDRVQEAAARAEVDASTLLGRVAAHEVGHLLLGRGYHGDTGVMRAQWPDAVLHARRDADWRFSSREALAMQRALIGATPLTFR